MSPSPKRSGRRWLTGVAVLALFCGAIGLSAPAGAVPGNDPCSATTNVFCRIAPIAPGLTGDVDLTGQFPNALQENDTQVPQGICARGCS